MDRSLRRGVPLFGSLEKHLDRESRRGDGFITITEPYCFSCGKFTPSKPSNGWETKVLKLKGLGSAGGDCCAVCALILLALRRYRDAICPESPLPEAVSVKCLPGRCLYISHAETGISHAIPTVTNSGSAGETSTPPNEASQLEDILRSRGIEIFVTPENAGKFKHIGVGRPVQHSLGDEGCIALAREWISECQSHHLHCRSSSNATLPSRVIDVGSHSREPRLVETSGASGRYAALSHCWGKVRPLTTTSTTLDDRLEAIPLNSLPKTFQDATLVARELGLQYLWIDSLCIIQDSFQDWEAESAKMCQVYQGATVTIAAVSAEDGRQGCFIPKAETEVCECIPIEIVDIDGSPLTAHIRRRKKVGHDIAQGRLFESEPLSSRAWVLQERLLSTRVLMFTSTELVFECQTELYCECGDFPFKYSFSSAMKEHRRLFLNHQSAYRLWRSTIERYSRRCLTFDRDVLPALSGLADMMMREHGLDAYIAGIWRGDLHKQLLWSKEPGNFSLTREEHDLLMCLPFDQIHQQVLPYRTRRPSELCPPTWSWASIRGAVWYGGKWLMDGALENLAGLVDVACEPATSNLLGSVSQGKLVLRAPAARVQLGFYEETLKDLMTRCRVGEINCRHHSETSGSLHQHDDSCIQWNREQWAVLDLPVGRGSPPLEGQDFWRIRIATQHPPHDGVELTDYAGRSLLGSLASEIADFHTIHYHLLLKKSEAFNGDVFERIGLFVLTVPSNEVYGPGKVATVTIV